MAMNQNPLNTLRCPKCGRTYTDATQTFCLEDGTRLVDASARDVLQPTIAAPPPTYPAETVRYQQAPTGQQQPAFASHPPPRSDFQEAREQSKAARSAMVLAVISLLGPLFGMVGLIIRILKSMRMIKFEGRIGIGGLSGGTGLLLGVLFGIAGLIVGLLALKKIRAGAAPATKKRGAMMAIIISTISIAVSILLFAIILSMLELAGGHFGVSR